MKARVFTLFQNALACIDCQQLSYSFCLSFGIKQNHARFVVVFLLFVTVKIYAYVQSTVLADWCFIAEKSRLDVSPASLFDLALEGQLVMR